MVTELTELTDAHTSLNTQQVPGLWLELMMLQSSSWGSFGAGTVQICLQAQYLEQM